MSDNITSAYMIVYTRPQLLLLSTSPLVKPPPNMPELKDWFGADLDQIVLRKDADSSSNTRDRRYRRDVEDGDSSSRPSFRSAISQPSQMGNFKHQSLRAGDRDKERDRDGDRERERDREGQERLRHLSDKYDRDRMALPASGPRGKERDGTSNASSRLTSHTQTSALSSRRADGTKKKTGEAVEDWRRSGEPSRNGREEKLENGRREDRERPRSRVRASSRSRRDTSTARREREEKREDRSSRGDRDDYRREKDDPRRENRDRDIDRDSEYDDPRHWRDDGKREERMAARRERETKDRPSERDSAWESSSDRRWANDERSDTRSKRPARDRKSGQGDDAKDREERRDREREREKEKEPAWMDAYIPNGPSFGILGGKGSDGELDGIQVWKKGMKEKELREKEKDQGSLSAAGQDESSIDSSTDKIDATEKQLDEIQLFKLLMKREEEKKKTDLSSSIAPASVDSTSNVPNGSRATTAAASDIMDSSQLENLNVPRAQLQIGDPLSTRSNSAPRDELVGSRNPPGSGYVPQMEHSLLADKTNNESTATYNPPSAPRLLSLGRPSVSSARSPATGNYTNTVHPASLDSIYNQYGIRPENSRPLAGFSPFEESSRNLSGEEALAIVNAQDVLRRLPKDRPSPNPDSSHLDRNSYDVNNGSYPGPRGSRFAKFFDNKAREPAVPLPKPQTPVGLSLPSPHPGQRADQIAHEPHGEQRTLEDIFTMLSNSSQGHRNVVNPPLTLGNNHPINQQTQNNLQLLQQAAYQQQQQIQNGHRMEPLYESRLDDRNFVPDGMVPGLRTIPPPRSRDTSALYSDGLDEAMHHNLQRTSQQQRLDSVYAGPPPLFNHQRNVGIPVQQTHFRGGPSPIAGQQGPLQNPQRLPPGLANLGGRPPHDPSHFLNMSGVPAPSLHGSLPLNGPPQQQSFNAFGPNGGLSYNGPLRGPLPTQQMQNSLNHMNSLAAPNSLNSNHAQLLAMSGVGIGGLRGVNTGLTPQQGQNAQVHNPLLSMRQQQPLPAHALPHMMPPHLSQQTLSGPTSQPAHDLMALLMGGPHRE